jgi:sulfur relay protein TusB/DsrH
MSGALHSIHHTEALAACLARKSKDDAVILLEDGVYAAVLNDNLTAYVLLEDLIARGLTAERVATTVTPITMKELVALTLAHNPLVTWF